MQVYEYGTGRTVKHHMRTLKKFKWMRAQPRIKTKALAFASDNGIGHHVSWLWRSRLEPSKAASAADKLHNDLLGPGKRLQKALISSRSVFAGASRSGVHYIIYA